MRSKTVLIALALGASALLGGCATQRAVAQARASFERAEAAGAATKAPYEYHSAKSYLEMAEHEEAEVDYRAAAEFAERSLQHSEKAIEKAGGGGR